MAPECLREQRARHRRVVECGGVKLNELDVRTSHASSQRHGQPITRGLGRVRGHRVELSGTSGGEHHVASAQLIRDAIGSEY